MNSYLILARDYSNIQYFPNTYYQYTKVYIWLEVFSEIFTNILTQYYGSVKTKTNDEYEYMQLFKIKMQRFF